MNWMMFQRACGQATLFVSLTFSAGMAATVNVTTPTDWFVEDKDGTPGYEINDSTSNMLKAAQRSSRQARSLMWITLSSSGIPTTATITSANLNVFPWAIGYSSPNTSADIEIVGLEPVFGSPHLLPFASGPILGNASFTTTGQMTSIPLDVSFLQDNLQADQLFVLRIQMANSGTDISMSSSRHSLASSRPYLEIAYLVPEPGTCLSLAAVLACAMVGGRPGCLPRLVCSCST